MLLLLNTNEGVDCLKYLLSNWQNRCPVLKVANWQITMEKEHLIMEPSRKTGTSPSERSEAFTNNQAFLIVKKKAVNQKTYTPENEALHTLLVPQTHLNHIGLIGLYKV